ncbi:MAG TPA: hypothetical protein VGD62_09850, partial [Acidobacteriaceae bacterium]
MLGTWMLRPQLVCRGLLLPVAAAALLLATGCERVMRGPRTDEGAQVRPDQIHDFDLLYNRNCAGCHGAEGKNGPAIPMNNPVYLALVGD